MSPATKSEVLAKKSAKGEGKIGGKEIGYFGDSIVIFIELRVNSMIISGLGTVSSGI